MAISFISLCRRDQRRVAILANAIMSMQMPKRAAGLARVCISSLYLAGYLLQGCIPRESPEERCRVVLRPQQAHRNNSPRHCDEQELQHLNIFVFFSGK